MRAILLTLLIIIGAFVAYSYWGANGRFHLPSSEPSTRSVGTSGAIDAQKARERGAELGEKAAEAANKVGESVSEAATTTKIKAKMALDDTVKSRTIDVTTKGTAVTLSGSVRTPAERARALALARETSGVTQVIDHLVVQPNDR
jgi:hyperosmotically inducible periplasmic protein